MKVTTPMLQMGHILFHQSAKFVVLVLAARRDMPEVLQLAERLKPQTAIF